MITAINSATNFRGVYSKKGAYFSESQKRTIENIKTTLGDKKDTKDFFVSQGEKKDSVSLSEVVGLKNIGVGVDSDNVTWQAEFQVGTYNEEYPFKIEDLNKAEKAWRNLNLYLWAFPIIVLTGILLAGFMGKKPAAKEINSEVKTELVQKADTLIQKADTLKNSIIKNIK